MEDASPCVIVKEEPQPELEEEEEEEFVCARCHRPILPGLPVFYRPRGWDEKAAFCDLEHLLQFKQARPQGQLAHATHAGHETKRSQPPTHKRKDRPVPAQSTPRKKHERRRP